MKKNHIDQSSQYSESKSSQSATEKKKETKEKKAEVIDPKKNDPTRNEELPIIFNII